jgi:hypothetical protein
MSDNADRYTLEGEADVRGYVTAIRVADGKRARVKQAWLKRVSDISGEWMPRSRTKAIRLGMLDWE